MPKRELLNLLIVLFLLCPLTVQAQSRISYQGELQHTGVPYNGTLTMEFRLWSDPVSTDPELMLGMELLPVQVVDGLFHI